MAIDKMGYPSNITCGEIRKVSVLLVEKKKQKKNYLELSDNLSNRIYKTPSTMTSSPSSLILVSVLGLVYIVFNIYMYIQTN